jgi:hypothetical protein
MMGERLSPERLEEIREWVHPFLPEGNALELLSHILALEEELIETQNEAIALDRENIRLRDYIRMALDELGVPGPGYPAPVANAVDFLNTTLQPQEPRGEGG